MKRHTGQLELDLSAIADPAPSASEVVRFPVSAWGQQIWTRHVSDFAETLACCMFAERAVLMIARQNDIIAELMAAGATRREASCECDRFLQAVAAEMERQREREREMRGPNGSDDSNAV